MAAKDREEYRHKTINITFTNPFPVSLHGQMRKKNLEVYATQYAHYSLLKPCLPDWRKDTWQGADK